MGIGDADYIITARIVAEDASMPGVAAVDRRLDKLERRAQGFGSILGGNIAKAFALAGGAAGIGVAVRGIASLNGEIQTATNGMASLFSAFSGAPIESSVDRARATISGLREDAKKGVGELANYTEGFQRIFGATGGMVGDKDIRKLTRNALAAGDALRGQEGMQLAPMDIAQALSSGVSARETPIVQTALQAIGMTSAAFNALNPAEKVETLNKAFETFAPGVELMGKSWSAQMSTLRDNVKDLIRTVTGPMFERWTQQLIKVNAWLEKNEETIATLAMDWGRKLLVLWDSLISKAGIYAGLVAGAYIAPGVAGSVKAASSGGGMLSKVGSAFGSGGLRGGIGALAGMGGAGVSSLSAALPPMWLVIGVVAAVTAAIGGMYGALLEYESVTKFVAGSVVFLTDAFSELFNAFGNFIGRGSALNLLGAAILGAVGGLIYAVGAVVKLIAMVTEAFALFVRLAGSGLKALYAVSTGDPRLLSEARQDWALAQADYNRGMADILGGGGGAGDQEAAWQGPVMPSGDHNNNFTGPITIHVKAEINEDPARIAIGMEEVLRHMERYRKQPVRPPKLPRF